MSAGRVADVLRTLAPGPDPRADGELVVRFVSDRDPDAFAELIRRHGPTVLGVCRRILGHAHDAEDAFQAVWLVLARRASDVRPPGSVGNWLYGVAVRTALKARALAAKRRHRLMAAARPESVNDSPPTASDLQAVLDQELARLPDKYRTAVVLCDLNGKSRSAAALELGWPEGTVAARLAKGRELLADRLGRRGVTLTAAGLATALAPEATTAAVPANLAADALTLATAYAAGGTAAVPPTTLALAEGVMRVMSLSRWKLPAVVMMTCGLAAGAIVAASPVTKPDAPLGPAPRTAQPADPPPAVERNEDLWVWQQRPAPVEEVGPVLSVAFAPNGQSFLTAGDGRVRLWTTNTLEPTTVAGNRTGLTRSAVAISTDGKSIAVVTPDGAQGMSFPVAGEAVQTLWVLRDVSGSAIAFSPDGKRVAVSDGLTLRAKDLPPASGEVSFGPLVNAVKNGAVAAVAWSPDGKRVVFLPNLKIDPEWPASGTASPDPAKATHWHAQIWGAGSGETMAFLKHGTSRLTALGWSADGSTIATADVDGGIVLWDGKTLAEKSRLKAPGEITCLALRADGKRLVAGVRGAAPKEPNDPASAPQVVVFTEWEPAKNWLESSTMGGPVGETVRGLAFSPDGKVLIGGTEGTEGKSGGLRVWDRVFLKAAGK